VSTSTTDRTDTSTALLARLLNEGYGPGAWHGPDLKAALAGVTAEAAFWRPASGRHSIAEIAIHHAYCARGVRAKLTGTPPEPFVLDGDDWFALPDERRLPWQDILALVDAEQRRLAAAVADPGAHRGSSGPSAAECVDLVLGITGHAIYHAGQIQLLRVLQAA